jgi:mRNA interferase RelE/StbE
MRNLILSKSSKKTLEKLSTSNPVILKAILLRLDELAVNPLTADYKELKGLKGYYRVRVQKYRIVYQFNPEDLKVVIIELRDKVYKNL